MGCGASAQHAEATLEPMASPRVSAAGSFGDARSFDSVKMVSAVNAQIAAKEAEVSTDHMINDAETSASTNIMSPMPGNTSNAGSGASEDNSLGEGTTNETPMPREAFEIESFGEELPSETPAPWNTSDNNNAYGNSSGFNNNAYEDATSECNNNAGHDIAAIAQAHIFAQRCQRHTAVEGIASQTSLPRNTSGFNNNNAYEGVTSQAVLPRGASYCSNNAAIEGTTSQTSLPRNTAGFNDNAYEGVTSQSVLPRGASYCSNNAGQGMAAIEGTTSQTSLHRNTSGFNNNAYEGVTSTSQSVLPRGASYCSNNAGQGMAAIEGAASQTSFPMNSSGFNNNAYEGVTSESVLPRGASYCSNDAGQGMAAMEGATSQTSFAMNSSGFNDNYYEGAVASQSITSNAVLNDAQQAMRASVSEAGLEELLRRAEQLSKKCEETLQNKEAEKVMGTELQELMMQISVEESNLSDDISAAYQCIEAFVTGVAEKQTALERMQEITLCLERGLAVCRDLSGNSGEEDDEDCY